MSQSSTREGDLRSNPHLENIPFVPTSLESTSLSSYYFIDLKYYLHLYVDDDNECNMDTGNSIQTNNDTVCDTDIFDIFNNNISGLNDNDQDPVSGDTASDTDSISDAHISTIADVSIIRKSNFLPEPFDIIN